MGMSKEIAMKKRIQYCQCNLRKQITASEQKETTAYIPAKFARVGKVVRIRTEDDRQWSDGWEVMTVGASVWSDDLPDSHSAIKSHRTSTGDTLPRNR